MTITQLPQRQRDPFADRPNFKPGTNPNFGIPNDDDPDRGTYDPVSYNDFVQSHGGKSSARLAGLYRKATGKPLTPKMKRAIAATAQKRQRGPGGGPDMPPRRPKPKRRRPPARPPASPPRGGDTPIIEIQ